MHTCIMHTPHFIRDLVPHACKLLYPHVKKVVHPQLLGQLLKVDSLITRTESDRTFY
jgi:hypothetical protein